MGVAGEIAQDFLGSCKWALAVDHPFAVAQWRQISSEELRVGQLGMLTEELQLPGFVSSGELVEQQSPEQSRQHAYRQEEVRSAFDPALAVEREAAPRHDHVYMGMMGPTPTIP